MDVIHFHLNFITLDNCFVNRVFIRFQMSDPCLQARGFWNLFIEVDKNAPPNIPQIR